LLAVEDATWGGLAIGGEDEEEVVSLDETKEGEEIKETSAGAGKGATPSHEVIGGDWGSVVTSAVATDGVGVTVTGADEDCIRWYRDL